jgi:SAM-dependent methyltransferase
MSEYEFEQVDFENPSALFVLEDIVKGLIGCPLLYSRYFRTFELKGDENVLDFGCGGGAGSRCLAKLLNRNGHLTCVDISNEFLSNVVEIPSSIFPLSPYSCQFRHLFSLQNAVFKDVSFQHQRH